MQIDRDDLLAIDIGNSRISCGLFKTGALVQTWHYPTREAMSAARAIADGAHGRPPVALCSVVPAAASEIKTQLALAGCGLFEVSAQGPVPISDIYQTMGADRVANAVAAWKLYGQKSSVIVVDMGTATTLTAVSADGRFCGGFITLGLGQTLAALHISTAQLPATRLEQTVTPQLAFDTDSAIVNGTFLAQIGLVEYWVRLARKTLKGEVTTVATGGWSEPVGRHSAYLDITDPCLTLKGIYLVAQAAAGLKDRD